MWPRPRCSRRASPCGRRPPRRLLHLRLAKTARSPSANHTARPRADTERRMTTRITTAARTLAIAGALLASVMATSAWAQPSGPLSVPPPGLAATAQIPMLKDVGLDQKPNAQIPLDTPFVDQDGRNVKIGDYFGKRPVVLQLAYFDCPLLCTQVVNGL